MFDKQESWDCHNGTTAHLVLVVSQFINCRLKRMKALNLMEWNQMRFQQTNPFSKFVPVSSQSGKPLIAVTEWPFFQVFVNKRKIHTKKMHGRIKAKTKVPAKEKQHCQLLSHANVVRCFVWQSNHHCGNCHNNWLRLHNLNTRHFDKWLSLSEIAFIVSARTLNDSSKPVNKQ